MRTTRHRVTLRTGERTALLHLISSGTTLARELAPARILLKADSPPDHSRPFDPGIAAAVEVSVVNHADVTKSERSGRHKRPQSPLQ